MLRELPPAARGTGTSTGACDGVKWNGFTSPRHPDADAKAPGADRTRHCKAELLEWARFNHGTLIGHDLHATGTTGALLTAELGLPVTRFASGPLGGDQQVGAAIVEGRIDFVIFFWDPLEPQPHDVDVKALLRVAVVHNVPIACNRATADFLLSSPLMHREYDRLLARSPLQEVEANR